MGKIDIQVVILPDIEIYGGDTTPWEVAMMHQNGTGFSLEETSGYSAVLTVTPFMHSAGLGSGGTNSYVLQKTGTIKPLSTGDVGAEFTFSTTDTKELAGKYTYQIEFNLGEASRVGQGSLHIMNNINR